MDSQQNAPNTRLLDRIYEGRINCLRENVDPVELIISYDLRPYIYRECGATSPFLLMTAPHENQEIKLMGMNVQFKRNVPTGIAIRDNHGDERVVA